MASSMSLLAMAAAADLFTIDAVFVLILLQLAASAALLTKENLSGQNVG